MFHFRIILILFFHLMKIFSPSNAAQECPTFWAGYGTSCYRFRWINTKSWKDAKTWCQAQNGDLLKLETTQERSWIINKTIIIDTNQKLPGTTWWMGLNDLNRTSEWVWGDGSLADNSVVLWSPGDPNSAGNRDCAGIKSGKVYLQNCATTSKYICERNRKVILPCNTDEKFQTFNGYCFRVHTELQSWYDAKTTCNNEGAELTTIDNAMDQTVVIDFARNTQKPYWIGLQSLQAVNNGPVKWLWSNGTELNPSVLFWNTNQPQITSNKQNSSCVYMSNTTTDDNAWVADWCGVRKSFVCKKPEGVCPNGWIAHQKKCYQFNIQYKYSWQKASSYCHSQGSTLVHIFGDAATLFLRGYFEDMRASGVDSFWIGAFDNNTDNGAFIWSDGQNTSRYQRWVHNPPNNTKGQLDCVYISTGDNNAYWRPTSECFTNKAFVCTVPIEKSNTIVTISTPAPSYTCDENWQLHGDYCYQFNDTRLSWSAARTACQGEGGDLVKITDADIQGFISSNTHQQEYWIGLNDRKTEKTYVWLTETNPTNYTRWNPHEPNNLQGENCVETRGPGWNDLDCSRQIKYICQKHARNYQLPASKNTLPPQKYSAKCGLLWEEDPNSDYCYMFNSEALDWEDSREMCKTHGGDLVSIITREESFYINARIQTIASPSVINAFWIGANDRSSEGGWRWSDGGPFAYLNWGPGEPNDNKHNEDCGSILYISNQQVAIWNDAPCINRLGYICKKLGLPSSTTRQPTPSPTPPPNMVYGCKPRWKANGEYCYLFSHQQLNWYNARKRCGQAGGSLVSIASDDEQNFVYSQMQSFNGTAVWIGLNDLATNRNFKWVDGSTVTYTNWAPTEPNNFFGAPEDCVMMFTSGCAKSGWTCKGGMWNDATCDTTSVIAGFVCKARKQLMSSTPKPENVGCALPAVGYGNYCYFPVSGITNSWLDADADCNQRFKGHLAAVNDRYTQAFLSSFLANKNDVFWIGLSDINVTGTYYWINRWPVRFTFWSDSHTGNEQHSCVSMRNTHPRGLWENKNCTEKHHYWCQYPRGNHSTPQVTMPTTTVAASCPSGWTGFGSHCYKVFNPTISANRKTWMEARDYCRSIGSNLASIHSQAEDQFISRTLLRSYSRSFWIGLNDQENENGYVWVDGTGTDYTNWYRGEPNNVKDSEDCVELSAYTKSWNDNNCYLSASFICKAPGGFQPLTTVAPPTAVTSSVCGTDLNWIYFNGSCYYVSSSSDSTKNIYDSTQFCNSKGGYLASIHSIDENNMLLTQITKNSIQSYWIGLNELSTTTFSWFDNTIFDFDFWSQGEPNDAYGAERCVVMTDRGGLWNDDNCNENYGFICKKLLSSHQPITPAPTPLIQGGCDHGFIGVPHSNKCFLIQNTNVVSWRTAVTKCRAFGTGYDIASISSASEQEFIIANTKGIDGSGLWIGLNSFRRNRHFSWQDSSQFTYQNWAKYQPNSYSQACVKQNLPGNRRIPESDRGKWDDIGCNNLLGYICEGQKVSGLPIATPPGSLCKSGYIPYGQGCYKMSSKTDWQTAATNCSNDGGSLTSIIDVYEEAFIKSVFINLNQSVWLGMTFSAQGTYTWLDGWPVSYTNWGSGQPVKAISGGCVAMINGMWSDHNCNSKFNFVCKITSATPPPKTAPPPGTCPTGQQHRGIYCYQGNVDASKSWPEANYMCQKIGMNLLSIHSQDESKFILDKLLKPSNPPSRYGSPNHSFWIGMNKGTSDGFTWTDHTPVNFLNWSPNEPSDPMNSTTEECVEMYTDTGKWNDVTCFVNRGYICKGLAANLSKTTTARMTMPNKQSSTATVSKQTTPSVIIGPSSVVPTSPAIPVTTPNPIPNIPNVANYNSGKTPASGSDLSTGGIVAILISVVFVLVIIGLAAIFIKRRSSRNGSGLGVGGIDNSLYYEKDNDKVNISNGNSNVGHEEDA